MHEPTVSPIAALAEGPELYRMLVENALDYAIFALDPEGRVVSWNEGAERIVGYTEDEILGRHLSVFYPDDIVPGKPDQALREAGAIGRYQDEGWRVRKDGSRLWASTVVTALRDGIETLIGFSVINRDLTDRRTIAQGYEENRQRYRSLLQNNPDAVFSFNLDGSIDGVNPACLDVCGFHEPELLGRSFLDLVVPSERDRIGACMREAAQGDSQQLESAIVHRDGRRVEVNVTVVPIVVREEILGLYAIADDITERKRAEAERASLLQREQRARAEAEQASRIKSDFLAVMSHELRTPLNVINGYTDLLNDEVSGPLTPLQRKQLSRIRSSSGHLLHLIDEILSLTRMEGGREPLQTEPIDLAELIRETAASIEPLANDKRLQLAVELPERPVRAVTDRAKLRQILLHLLSNAAKFTDQGRIEVALYADGEMRVLSVRDTGIGIAAEDQDRIWEAFWQGEQNAARRAEGTGLGLTVTKRLVELLGGRIEVESELSRGSTFHLHLPASPQRPELASA